MKKSVLVLPPGASVLDASGRGGTGNVTLFFGAVQPPLVLKLYRTRRSLCRELLHDFSDRFQEGKRGARALTRWATERAAIAAWNSAGFAVPRIVDRPLPDTVTPPATWLEWIDGVLLSERLRDASVAVATKLDWIAAYAAETGRRHRHAIAAGETLLIHEHPGPQHVLVAGKRLVTFDLENAFAPRFPVLEAAAQEAAGFLYALDRLMGADADMFLTSYVRAYGQGSLLPRLAHHIVSGRGWYRRIKRFSDRRRRHGKGKTAAMEKALAIMGFAPGRDKA